MQSKLMLIPIVLFGVSCANTANKTETTTAKEMAKELPKATAELESKNKSKAKGVIHFTETDQGLEIHYMLTGLAKNQMHGFHIHEMGDCSAPDAKSAGSHYKEVAKTGGTSADTPGKHAGDLPQIKSDANGNAEGTVVSTDVSLTKDNKVTDRAIIVHGGPDNPKKKSAPRIACGLIKMTASGTGTTPAQGSSSGT